MKFFSVTLPLLAFVTSVVAQTTYINYPKAGSVFHKGQNVTVQIVAPVRPDSFILT
jgi:hypothetical protein